MGKCFLLGCNKKTLIFAGSCKFCEHDYCMLHRLPEDHECENYDRCCNEAREKLKTSITNNAMKTPTVVFS